MTARIIDGNAIAEAVRADVAREVAALVESGRPVPKLAVILVGDDPASHVYVRMKERDAEAVGMQSEAVRLPADTSHADVLAHLHRLNDDPRVSGLFMQLPVPDQVDDNEIIEAINPLKDVDGLTAASLGMLVQGKAVHSPLPPPGSSRCSAARASRRRGRTW